MDSLITRTEFARQIGVTKAVLDSTWLRTDHPHPSYKSSSGRLRFYSRQQMTDWWAAAQSEGEKKKESSDITAKVFQVNSRFSRAECERIYKLMEPKESFSAAFRRLALLGLQVLERGKEASDIDATIMRAARKTSQAEEKTRDIPDLRKIT